MSNSETTALDSIDAALSTLRTNYSEDGGVENRRDQISEFLKATFDAVEILTDLAGADALIIERSAEGVQQDIADAFLDAVEAEQEAEPRIDPVREWGTYNTPNGSVA